MGEMTQIEKNILAAIIEIVEHWEEKFSPVWFTETWVNQFSKCDIEIVAHTLNHLYDCKRLHRRPMALNIWEYRITQDGKDWIKKILEEDQMGMEG